MATGIGYIQISKRTDQDDSDTQFAYVQMEPAPEGNDLTSPLISGDFIISLDSLDLSESRILGHGAFGEVRSGTWCGVDVAIKQILSSNTREDVIQSLLREMAVVSTLRHPNIVSYFGCTVNPTLQLVQELLQGSLRDFLDTQPASFSYKRILNIAQGIVRGLWYLHNHMPIILHLDLTSKNVLMTSDGQPKLADFGLSRAIQSNHGQFEQVSQVCNLLCRVSDPVFCVPGLSPTVFHIIYFLFFNFFPYLCSPTDVASS